MTEEPEQLHFNVLFCTIVLSMRLHSPCGSPVIPNTLCWLQCLFRRHSCSSKVLKNTQVFFSLSTSHHFLFTIQLLCLALTLTARHLCLFGFVGCTGFLCRDPFIPLYHSSSSCTTKIRTFSLGLDPATLRGTEW